MRQLRILGVSFVVLSMLLAVAAPVAAQQMVTVTLSGPVGSGNCTLTAVSATSTSVSCSVSNFKPSTTQSLHIHTGTCALTGAFQFALPDLSTNAQGNGSSTGTVAAALSNLAGLIIQTPHGVGIVPDLCGVIPSVAAAPTPTPAMTPAPAMTPVPAMTPAPTPAPARPAPTGAFDPGVVAVALAALGLLALGGSRFLRRPSA